nr:immunoglobulin heavy chain junction region [Macaca mulatta]
CARGFGEFW